MKYFHAHVYFDIAQYATAAALRRQAALRLPGRVGALHNQPIGPHPKGMFQLFFSLENFAEVVLWLMQHRGDLDILVHGDTGQDLIDHTQHVMWLGQSQPLRLGILAAGAVTV